jgi:zinc/manganese transport system substrate-binding protein
MKSLLLAVFAAATLALPVGAAPITILAAENFYGEAAQAIGGDRVAVESVIVAPGTDPHDFDPPPSVARLVADAKIVVMNGADYDPWMMRLVDANHVDGRVVIDVAALSGHKPGDNPHVWYDPKAMPALADALTAELVTLDPPRTATSSGATPSWRLWRPSPPRWRRSGRNMPERRWWRPSRYSATWPRRLA